MTSAELSPVKSADRVLLLLEYLSDSPNSTFTQIVRDLKFPNSSAHQLLLTAVQRGFVSQDDQSKRYSLGARLWEIAQTYSVADELTSLARPYMDELVRKTKETVQLSHLQGLENVYLAISESPHVMKLVSTVGSRLPAHTTGLGKTLLASLDEVELRSRLEGVTLESFTNNTITDIRKLAQELDQIRRQGFGEDIEEYVIGCRCIAMPIRDPRGIVMAALSVSVPTPRYSEHVARAAHSELAETIRQIESALNSRVAPTGD